MRIRKALLEDLQAIAENNMAMALETEGKRLDREKALQGARAVLEGKADAVYYVVEEKGKVVCQLMITREWSDWRNCFFWWIQSVYTLPAERGKGHFRRLFSFVIERAKEEGACGLRLYVDRSNTRAMEVYEALGMSPTHYELYELEF